MNSIFHGDCLDVLERNVPESATNVILTSPPYANQRKHNYGGIDPAKYVSRFLNRAEEFKRVLTLDGSMVLNICPHTENGEEARYVRDLLDGLQQTWYLLATYCWRKTTCLPGKFGPRLKNAWEPCYHFALRKKPAFYPEQVMRAAAESSKKRAANLRAKDFERQESSTGSKFGVNREKASRHLHHGGRYTETNTGSGFQLDTDPNAFYPADGMVYPDNVIEAAPEVRNLQKLYGDPRYDNDPKASAPFPEALPAFFIELLTRRGDTVLDPFAGSGTTAAVAQRLSRNSIAIEKEEANIRLICNRLQDQRRRAAR